MCVYSVYVYKYIDTEYISGIHCQSGDYMLSSPPAMRTDRKIYWGDERRLMNRCLWRIRGEWIAKNFQENRDYVVHPHVWIKVDSTPTGMMFCKNPPKGIWSKPCFNRFIKKEGTQVIQSDLFIPKRWRSPTTFDFGSRFHSPS